VSENQPAPAADQPDEYAEAAFKEEQEELSKAVMSAQAQHLMNRVIQLATKVKRLEAQLADYTGAEVAEDLKAKLRDLSRRPEVDESTAE